ncbi:GGDEF domain-containing protein [Cellulomonas sp. ATA003]|uniref:GGDEF domain-containing protein n=1 Tax=Cellulomonas sp. ATA003 TaxID=3073064 RepID=UPI002872F4BB|nr:GGDEF domain-containing protein [Cellulomonas sp. ATA003]WNB84297.1 GGDEF domain-containing protein [Cellulomonas sp. ATA003]
MTQTSDPSRHGLVPLVDRVRWAGLLRIGLFGAAAGLVLTAPTRSLDAAALIAGAHLTFVLVALLASRLGRKATITALNASLVLDGFVLAAVVHVLGNLSGFVTALYVIHVSAVSLLMSFRTGVKVALWHSLVVLVFLHASATGVLRGGTLEGRPVIMTTYLGFLLLLWVAALGTSAFAALNERELRRRRYDAEVLHRLAVALSTVDDPESVVHSLARAVVDDLGVRRALVAVTPGQPTHDGGLVTELCVVLTSPESDKLVLGPADRRTAVSTHGPTTGCADAPGSLLARVPVGGGPVLAIKADPTWDEWLVQRLPQAQGIVALPLPLGDAGRGWLVLELGRRRLNGVDRRLLSTAEQAVAHAALALTRAAAVASLRRIAETDGLTGVGNRRAFDAALAHAIDTARSGQEGFSVALMDLDHFKAVNDSHGHAVGDEVLRAAAHAVRMASRTGDMVARYGGEEFAVILPGDARSAVSVADRLRRAVETSEAPLPVTCSVGVAPWTADASIADVLRSADSALYRAKAAGRNRTVDATEAEVDPISTESTAVRA